MKITNIQELDKLLEDYEKNLSLRVSKPEEHDKYLNLTIEEIRTLTPEECGIGVYVLERYALYIQKQCNTEQARVNWLKANLKTAVIQLVGSFDKYLKYDEREQLAIKESEYAGKLEQLRQYAQARLDRLSFLPGKINLVSNALLNVQKTKSFANKNLKGDF